MSSHQLQAPDMVVFRNADDALKKKNPMILAPYKEDRKKKAVDDGLGTASMPKTPWPPDPHFLQQFYATPLIAENVALSEEKLEIDGFNYSRPPVRCGLI